MEEKFAAPSHDEIQVGYNVDDESAKINDPTHTVKRNRTFEVSILYAKRVKKGEGTTAKLQIVNTKNKQSVFEDTWQESYGNSGKTTEINPKTWEAGQYRIELYRGNKLITSKEIKVD
jgi:hypothetical protein